MRSITMAMLAVVALYFGLQFIGKKQTPKKSSGETKLIIAHQSNRNASLEPCGCSYAPHGGADREANAIEMWRKETGNLLYVDAGNFLAPPKLPSGLDYHREKAASIVNMFNQMGLDAFAPGPNDFALGPRHLKSLARQAKFAFVNANTLQASGMQPVFEPFTIIERGGFSYGIIGLSNPSKLKVAGLVVQSPNAALKRYLPRVRAQADFIVLLSQLGPKAERKLTEDFPEVNVIVGSDHTYGASPAAWFASGQTLLVDTRLDGFALGRLDLNLRFPFKGFYSPKRIAENQAELKSLEARLAANPSLSKRIANYKKFRDLAPIEGGSQYQHELVELDKERFGAANNITQLIAAERERVRLKALAE